MESYLGPLQHHWRLCSRLVVMLHRHPPPSPPPPALTLLPCLSIISLSGAFIDITDAASWGCVRHGSWDTDAAARLHPCLPPLLPSIVASGSVIGLCSHPLLPQVAIRCSFYLMSTTCQPLPVTACT
jgi:hypothetical protein